MTIMRILALVIFWGFVSLAYAKSADAVADVDLVTATQGGIVYAVPKGSPLRLSHIDENGTHFSGSVRISGHYLYGQLEALPAEESDFKTLYFVPDEASKALLPYWNERGPVRALYFSNSDEFLSKVVDASLAQEVKSNTRKSLTGEVTIWIDEYVATAECDSAVYTARFVKVDQPDTVAQSDYVDSIGCV